MEGNGGVCWSWSWSWGWSCRERRSRKKEASDHWPKPSDPHIQSSAAPEGSRGCRPSWPFSPPSAIALAYARARLAARIAPLPMASTAAAQTTRRRRLASLNGEPGGHAPAMCRASAARVPLSLSLSLSHAARNRGAGLGRLCWGIMEKPSEVASAGTRPSAQHGEMATWLSLCLSPQDWARATARARVSNE
jgi:hypothetical protein